MVLKTLNQKLNVILQEVDLKKCDLMQDHIVDRFQFKKKEFPSLLLILFIPHIISNLHQKCHSTALHRFTSNAYEILHTITSPCLPPSRLSRPSRLLSRKSKCCLQSPAPRILPVHPRSAPTTSAIDLVATRVLIQWTLSHLFPQWLLAGEISSSTSRRRMRRHTKTGSPKQQHLWNQERGILSRRCTRGRKRGHESVQDIGASDASGPFLLLY